MLDAPREPLDAVLIGRLQRDYLLPFERPAQVDILGGALPYARLRHGDVGAVRQAWLACINADYPLDWLLRFQELGHDLQGIKTVDEPIDARRSLPIRTQLPRIPKIR